MTRLPLLLLLLLAAPAYAQPPDIIAVGDPVTTAPQIRPGLDPADAPASGGVLDCG